MCFTQTGNISTLNSSSLKLVDKFTYQISSVSSTEKDINTRLVEAWIAIDRLSVIWKSDLTDKIKQSFFQAVVISILLYGCTTWTLTKRMEKKLDSNYTRMLWAILNKSWKQHPTKQQLYSHLPLITKTIKIRQTRHAGHCWRSRDELISDVLLWTPSEGQAMAGWLSQTYIQQLCADMRAGERESMTSVLMTRHDDDGIKYLGEIYKKCVVSRFFACIPSMIQWIVRTLKVVDQFLQKLFRFFLRTFSA